MRLEKKAITEEIRASLEGSAFVLLTNYSGLTVEQTSNLRRLLRESGSEFHVVKNTFFSHAVDGLGWEGVCDLIDGPTAIVIGEGDVTRTAKMLRTFVKENGLPVVRGGVFENRILTAEDVDVMATIPPREVMLARVVGTIAAPLSQMVGVLNQKVLSLLYVLKAVEEKKNENN